MDDNLGLVDRALGLIAHWPDAACMVGGSLFGYLLTLMGERWFLPIVTDPHQLRKQQGLTFVGCWLASAMSSIALWTVWDPADPWPARIITSLVVGLILSFVYPVIAAWATSRWASIGSAWAKKS